MTRQRLLIVDDEALNRDMLTRRLERHAFEVAAVASGEAALRYVHENPVDLVLLDIMMPGMSGIEMLQSLRATYSPEQLPVIMVSALRESDQVVEALNLGANDYITKPVDLQVALARIRSQLARKEAESALRKSEERYALAARGANDGLWEWDVSSNRFYYSGRWKAMLGYEDGEIGDSEDEWFSRLHPEDVSRVRQALRGQVDCAAAETFQCQLRMRHRDGTYRWMQCRGAAIRDSGGHTLRMAGSLSDITAAKAFDPLTALANRVLFTDRLEQEIANFQNSSASQFAVMFLDMDRFKLINDGLGHVAGDRLLVAVAERLMRGVRAADSGRAGSRDLVARLGGDEFAVLLTDLTAPADASRIAERILSEVGHPFELSGRTVFCTVSIGIVLSSSAYQSAEEMVRDADTAMYSAKNRGRACFEIFDESMRTRVLRRMEVESELRSALDNQELTVYYQPKVRLTDQRIFGFEALVRWIHPQRGLILPSEFIPIAEESGLIHRIGMWVLREACLQMKKWHREYPGEPPLSIGVNVSAIQFRQPDLTEQIVQVLEETGLPASSLKLEITESVLLDDREAALEILRKLKIRNIGLKIDDFGTGYSSLSYLAQLPFDTVKIDQSFTKKIHGGDCNLEIVKTILNMAHTLGMQVIAEGVENVEQIADLKSLGCEFAQGFYFSKAVPASDAARLLVNSRTGGAAWPIVAREFAVSNPADPDSPCAKLA